MSVLDFVKRNERVKNTSDILSPSEGLKLRSFGGL